MEEIICKKLGQLHDRLMETLEKAATSEYHFNIYHRGDIHLGRYDDVDFIIDYGFDDIDGFVIELKRDEGSCEMGFTGLKDFIRKDIQSMNIDNELKNGLLALQQMVIAEVNHYLSLL